VGDVVEGGCVLGGFDGDSVAVGGWVVGVGVAVVGLADEGAPVAKDGILVVGRTLGASVGLSLLVLASCSAGFSLLLFVLLDFFLLEGT